MDAYSELVESLERCIAVCNNCASSCLDEEQVQKMTDCIKLNLDCADICQLTLKLLARDSDQSVSAVQLCKDICADCAKECNKFKQDHCQICADECQRCVKQCQLYIKYMVEPVSSS